MAEQNDKIHKLRRAAAVTHEIPAGDLVGVAVGYAPDGRLRVRFDELDPDQRREIALAMLEIAADLHVGGGRGAIH